MHSHVQPWFKADVEAILDEPDIAAVREGKYVGMHIRRTDKINDGVTLTPTEVRARRRNTRHVLPDENRIHDDARGGNLQRNPKTCNWPLQ